MRTTMSTDEMAAMLDGAPNKLERVIPAISARLGTDIGQTVIMLDRQGLINGHTVSAAAQRGYIPLEYAYRKGLHPKPPVTVTRVEEEKPKKKPDVPAAPPKTMKIPRAAAAAIKQKLSELEPEYKAAREIVMEYKPIVDEYEDMLGYLNACEIVD